MQPAARLLIDPVFSTHIHGIGTPGLGIPPDPPIPPLVCIPHIVTGFTTALARAVSNALFKGSPGFTVFINNLPAAQCSDGGWGLLCCGPNTYDIFTGSSTVNIDGDRAARCLDTTFHCDLIPIKPMNPPKGPPKPGVGIPPFGIITSGSPNVFIGGFPLPSFTALAGALLMKGLSKLIGKVAKKLAKTAKNAIVNFALSRVAKSMKGC